MFTLFAANCWCISIALLDYLSRGIVVSASVVCRSCVASINSEAIMQISFKFLVWVALGHMQGVFVYWIFETYSFQFSRFSPLLHRTLCMLWERKFQNATPPLNCFWIIPNFSRFFFNGPHKSTLFDFCNFQFPIFFSKWPSLEKGKPYSKADWNFGLCSRPYGW